MLNSLHEALSLAWTVLKYPFTYTSSSSIPAIDDEESHKNNKKKEEEEEEEEEDDGSSSSLTAAEMQRLVFRDLHRRGYFVGPGDVYGGDYNIYKVKKI